jgi:2-isopropylmalate synthase
MDLRSDSSDADTPWEVPYLMIDPEDLGRTYEAIVRINSQSGKGGVAYVMSRDFGFEMPKAMHPEMGSLINSIADQLGRELSGREIYEAFNREYLNREKPLELVETSFKYVNGGGHNLECTARVKHNGEERAIQGSGNGPIDAFVHALREAEIADFTLTDFHEHAIGSGSQTEAVAYIEVELQNGRKFWGAGVDTNIDLAGIKALVSAFDRAHAE